MNDLERGSIVAFGSRSEVRAWGDDTVAKIPNDSTPLPWIRYEAQYTAAVWALGVSTHKSVGMSEHEGKPIGIYERVSGPTLWAVILDDPQRAGAFGEQLANIHARILTSPAPIALPRQIDRLTCKIRRAIPALDLQLEQILACLPTKKLPVRLCHGDFHPGNIIMSPDGPVVIDWFDACRGSAVGDIARTSLLLGLGGRNVGELAHLPGHTKSLLADVHSAYLETVLRELGVDRQTLEQWRRAEAIARAAVGADPRAMVAVWNDWAGHSAA